MEITLVYKQKQLVLLFHVHTSQQMITFLTLIYTKPLHALMITANFPASAQCKGSIGPKTN